MKIVTICGSMRFKKEMMEIAYNLETNDGYCVLQCVYGGNCKPSDKNLQNLAQCHFKKIDISDMIYVVNIGGYIGDSTKKEIEYAQLKGKQVV